MANEPLISKEDRPDLTIDLEGKLGNMTVRDLANILGVDPAQLPKPKELPVTATDKIPTKEIQKDVKDRKDTKDHKDQKEPKDHKDQKDTKDHKDPKEQKDQKDQKEHKDQKDAKEQKDTKDQKDPKEHKDQKDHKDPKEHKDQKDHKDLKESAKEIKDGFKEVKEPVDVAITNPGPEAGQGPENPSQLDQLVKRISGLEQSMDELKKAKK